MAQVANERLSSADQLGDRQGVMRWVGYLRDHAEDSLSTYQRGLLNANDIEGAAALLVSRLENPDHRMDALLEVQEFATDPIGERSLEMERRRQAMLTRPEVQAAISRVGFIHSYPLHRPY